MLKFTMKSIIRQTGLSEETLRAWERRYQAVTPERTANNRRSYSRRDAERLKLLAYLVKVGHRISEIAPLDDQKLIALVSHYKNYASTSAIEHYVLLLLEQLKSFSYVDLKRSIQKIRFELSPKDFVFHIIPQTMNQVDQLFQQGVVSITQEHAISEIFSAILYQIFTDLNDITDTNAQKGTIILATPEGESHQLGLLIVAVLLKSKGFNVIFLGINLPTKNLVTVCQKVKPVAIALSITLLAFQNQAQSFRQLLSELAQGIPQNCAIWIGGSQASKLERMLKRNSLRRKILFFESIEEFEENFTP